MRVWIVVLGFVWVFFSVSEGLVEIGNLLPIEQVKPETTTIINNEQMLGLCLEKVQRHYFPVSLPSLTERLFQPAGSFPVDWGKFDPKTRKLFRGWIDGHGIVHYAVGLYEDYFTGEIVVLDDSGWEMFRIQRRKSYDPYDLQREFFDLGKKEVLENEFTRNVFLPHKISTVVDLVPLVFWDTHLQIEQEMAAQQFSAPMMMMSMASSGNEKATASMVLGTNGLITLYITVPEGEDWRYLQIFKKDDLAYSSSWTLCEEWLPSYQNAPVSFEDTSSSGLSKRFYHLSNYVDSDGDGFSDLIEAWGMGGTGSNIFDNINIDGDSMLDAWEMKLFGSLDEEDLGDFDGDLIPNIEELVPGEPPVMITDPSLYSSDGDALSDMEMFDFPPTDSWNPDTDKPSASILYPTNNAVVAF